MDSLSGNRVDNVSAVELTHRKQVQCGNKHRSPGSPVNGIPLDEFWQTQQLGNDDEKKWIVELHIAVDCAGGRRCREDQPNNRRRKRERKASKRTCDANVEQRATTPDWLFYLYHRSECSKESDGRRRGDKERKRRSDFVMPAGEVMAELVCSEDRQQCERKQQTL